MKISFHLQQFYFKDKRTTQTKIDFFSLIIAHEKEYYNGEPRNDYFIQINILFFYIWISKFYK